MSNTQNRSEVINCTDLTCVTIEDISKKCPVDAYQDKDN